VEIASHHTAISQLLHLFVIFRRFSEYFAQDETSVQNSHQALLHPEWIALAFPRVTNVMHRVGASFLKAFQGIIRTDIL
jgi:hypothetical protein